MRIVAQQSEGAGGGAGARAGASVPATHGQSGRGAGQADQGADGLPQGERFGRALVSVLPLAYSLHRPCIVYGASCFLHRIMHHTSSIVHPTKQVAVMKFVEAGIAKNKLAVLTVICQILEYRCRGFRWYQMLYWRSNVSFWCAEFVIAVPFVFSRLCFVHRSSQQEEDMVKSINNKRKLLWW